MVAKESYKLNPVTQPKIIGQGQYGCVYSPPIPCLPGGTTDATYVTKIEATKYADLDYQFGQILQRKMSQSKFKDRYVGASYKCDHPDPKLYENIPCSSVKDAPQVSALYYRLVPNAITLYDWAAKAPLPDKQAKVLRQILAMLMDMHASSVVHGDLHGQNILLDSKTEQVYFIDFNADVNLNPSPYDGNELKRNDVEFVFKYVMPLLTRLPSAYWIGAELMRNQTIPSRVLDELDRPHITGLEWTALPTLKTLKLNDYLVDNLRDGDETKVETDYVVRFNPSIAHMKDDLYLLKYRAFAALPVTSDPHSVLRYVEYATPLYEQIDASIFQPLGERVFALTPKESLLELIQYVQAQQTDLDTISYKFDFKSLSKQSKYAQVMLTFYWQPEFHRLLTEPNTPRLLTERKELWNSHTPALDHVLRYVLFKTQTSKDGDNVYLSKMKYAVEQMATTWLPGMTQNLSWLFAFAMLARSYVGQKVSIATSSFLDTTFRVYEAKELIRQLSDVIELKEPYAENILRLVDSRTKSACQGEPRQTFCQRGSSFIPYREMLSAVSIANPDSLHPAYNNWRAEYDIAGFAIVKIDATGTFKRLMFDELNTKYAGNFFTDVQPFKSDFADARIMKTGPSTFQMSDECFVQGRYRHMCVWNLTVQDKVNPSGRMQTEINISKRPGHSAYVACDNSWVASGLRPGKNWSPIEGTNKFLYQFLPTVTLEMKGDICTMVPGSITDKNQEPGFQQLKDAAKGINPYYAFTASDYRFSLGTPSIIFNDTEFLGVGHSRFYRKDLMDVDPSKKKSDWTPNYAAVLAEIEDQVELYQTSNYNYFMYFYTLDRKTLQVTRMSHSFLVVGQQPYYLAFPCGLTKMPNTDMFMLSYGEGDVRCKIALMDRFDIESLLEPIAVMTQSAEYHKFLLLGQL